jgi:hypothetical protein
VGPARGDGQVAFDVVRRECSEEKFAYSVKVMTALRGTVVCLARPRR